MGRIMIRTASKEDIKGILKVLEGAFKVKKESKKWKDWKRLVTEEPENWRVLLLNNQIIGAVHIGKDKLRVGKSAILKGDIGEVSILPEYQHKGYGTELMKDTVAWMRKERYDISRLGGLVKFYSRFGYIRFPRRYIEFSVGSKVKAGASLVEEGEIPLSNKFQSKIKPFNPKEDYSSYIKLYEEFNQVYNGSFIYTKREKITYPKCSPNFLNFVFKEEKEILGYLFAEQLEKEYSEFEAEITIGDIGYKRDKPYIFESLIKYINNLACKKRIKRITARIPFDPQILEILSNIPIHFQCIETYGGKGSNMLQIINFHSLFERLTSELEDRLKNSVALSWQGILEMKIEKDKVQLYINKGKIKVVKNKKPNLSIFIKEVYLLKLILGILSFIEIKEILDKKMKFDSLEATLLNDLFLRKRAVSGNWG